MIEDQEAFGYSDMRERLMSPEIIETIRSVIKYVVDGRVIYDETKANPAYDEYSSNLAMVLGFIAQVFVFDNVDGSEGRTLGVSLPSAFGTAHASTICRVAQTCGDAMPFDVGLEQIMISGQAFAAFHKAALSNKDWKLQ